jgi:hypothetical protein
LDAEVWRGLGRSLASLGDLGDADAFAFTVNAAVVIVAVIVDNAGDDAVVEARRRRLGVAVCGYDGGERMKVDGVSK